MRVKLYLLIALTALFIPLLTAPLRAFVNIQTGSLLGFVGYFIAAIFWFKSGKNSLPVKVTLLALVTGFLLFELIFRITGMRSALVSLPDAFMHMLGIALGYLFSEKHRAIAVISSVAGLILVLLMYFYGYNQFIQHLKSHYSKVEEVAPSFVLTTLQNERLTNADFRNRLLVLDFWTTSCSPCFRDFPRLQQMYDTCRTREDTRISAVNVPISGDSAGEARFKLTNLGYTFPLIVATNDSLVRSLRVISYPTVLMIQNGGRIIYRGDLDGVGEILDKELNAQ